MRKKTERFIKLFLALALSAVIMLENGILPGLASQAAVIEAAAVNSVTESGGIAAVSAETESAPVGTAFPSDFSADLVESDYLISTTEEFVRFAAASRSYGFAGVTIHLTDDIDYSDGYEGTSFAGIGSADTPFCGTFDGHGYTVRNLYSTSTGMFHVIGSTENPAVIRNVTLDSAAISGAEGRAVLVSRFTGNPQDVTANNLIENVTVSNSTGSFSGNNCGILVGRCLSDDQAITISGCAVTDCDLICTATSETNVNQWGLIIGKDRSLGYSRILNCSVAASNIISTGCNLDRAGLVAGLVYGAARIDGCKVITSSITSGLASGTVTQELGGIVGRLQSGYGVISNCTVATTSITTQGLCQYVGLLAGHLYGCTLENNTVTQSTIHAAYEDTATGLSGLVGYISGGPATINGCKTSRILIRVAGGGTCLGGLAGSIEAESAGTAIRDSSTQNSYITTADASQHLGGAIGGTAGRVTAENVSVVNINITTGGDSDGLGGFAGAITDTAGSALTDCSVLGSSVMVGGSACYRVSGFVGSMQGSGQIIGCTVAETTLTARSLCQYVGLLAGQLSGGTVQNNKVFNSRICAEYNATNSQASRIGGLVGSIGGSKAKVSGCNVENVSITNASRVNSIGGLIGNLEASSAGTIIRDCAVTNLTMDNTYSANSSNSFYIGGAIGRCLGKAHITNVSVDGAVITVATLVQAMGGFAGYMTGSAPSVLTDCSVSGVTITQTQTALDDSYQCYHVAGFVGCVDVPSKLEGCSVTETSVTMQGRVYYLGGLIGSTYSDVLQSTPCSGAVTVKNCAVVDFAFATKQSRNCNEFGGLIGWLSEGSMVTNCFVSGVSNPSNTNSVHVGGLIGYIAESTTDAVDTVVKNCYVHNGTLNGKTSISATIGNAVASSEVFTNNHYYNCTLNGGTESNASGAAQVTTTSNLTNGTLAASLNTTGGTAASTNSWVQGAGSPVLNANRSGSSEVKVMSFNIYYLTQNESYPISGRQSKVIDLIDACYNDGVGVFGLQEVTGIWYDYINNYLKNENTNLVWSGYGRYGGTFGGFASGTNATNDSFNLILYDKTKYDKTDEGHFWLSDTPDQKSLFYSVAYNYRVVNWVRLRDKTTGEEFVFVNAHLEDTKSTAVVNDWGYTIDASCGPAARIKQAQLICDQMAVHADDLPVIIVGDWNSYGGTDGYSTIMAGGYQDLRAIAETADTCGSYNAWSRTDTSKFSFGDHIAASGLCTAVLYDVLIEEDVDSATGYHLSDHSPLIATILY